MLETAPDAVNNTGRTAELGETVVVAVAEAKGVDPLELDPIYDVVDPDALDSLFRSTGRASSSTLKLCFSMAGCQVVVHGDGEVVVTRSTADEASPATVATHES